MINRHVLDMLLKHDPIEEEQLEQQRFVQDLPNSTLSGSFYSQGNHVTIKNSYFFLNRDIYISKHHRFAAYPIHSHSFLEMNYVIRGGVDEMLFTPQQPTGRKLHLTAGDLILIDQQTRHSINYLDSNDLMVNILFQDRSIDLQLLEQMRGSQSILYQFFLDHYFNQDNQKIGYMVFRHEECQEISATIEEMINEYYQPQSYSNIVIRSLMSILLIQLVRNFSFRQPVSVSKKQQLIMNVLNDIDDHYQNISLAKEAANYSYNPSYLSQLIHQSTGNSFSELLLKRRLKKAQELLKTTKLPLVSIMKKVGISNRNYFNHKYEIEFGKLPSQDRS